MKVQALYELFIGLIM